MLVSLAEDLEILAYHGLKSLIESLADHSMTDRDLIQLGDILVRRARLSRLRS